MAEEVEEGPDKKSAERDLEKGEPRAEEVGHEDAAEGEGGSINFEPVACKVAV